MIAWLNGRVRSCGEDSAIIDVGGVGYLVFCSARTLRALPAAGGTAALDIDTHVREDHIHLYGFAEPSERAWFRLMQTVQGVGARVSLGVLSVLSPGELTQAVAAQDHVPLTRASGVGPKLARRIVAELKDRVPALTVVEGGGGDRLPSGGADGDTADAVSALVNLGYGRSEAFGAVASAAREFGDGVGVEALIRAGLKVLAK
jgi:Holliday junction DNA helicase RuvA